PKTNLILSIDNAKPIIQKRRLTAMPLYWLCYRYNNSIFVVIEPGAETWNAAPKAQATFFRRRHQPSRPTLAKMRPGSPAPAIGPGTPRMGPGTNNADEFAVMMASVTFSGMKKTNSATM